jgi:hypothetical protein
MSYKIPKVSVILPDDFFDSYYSGCGVGIEADGHTGIRVSFSTDIGRFEEEAENPSDIPAAYRRGREKWKKKFDKTQKTRLKKK